MRKQLYLILAIVLAFGCATTKKQVAEEAEKQLVAVVKSTPDEINQIKWKVIGMSGMNVSTVSYGEGKPWVQINSGDSSVKGFSGCNTFGGTIEIAGDSINFGMMMMTKKFCEGIPEPEFLKLLEETETYHVKGTILNFKKGEKILITFVKSNE